MDIGVCIFEDNKPLRESLGALINGSPGYTLAGAWSDASKVVLHINECKPDVVLMDINMPGISGIEAVLLIRQQFPDMPILMQTVFEGDDKVFASICAGASGYILKNTPPVRLLEAIKEVHEGGAAFTPSIARKVLKMATSQNTNPAEYINLSEREKEVLEKLVEGMSYKMAAAALDISIDTVHTHISNIYVKLHVNSKSEAVAKAIRQKLV
jgi:DNA-binding NarL/FixJ family response regulator